MNKKTVVLICASVDNNSEVNSLAKLNLRSSPETDLNENPELLRLLIDLYAGRILRGLSAQPVKVPIGLKFIIARQFQRVRTFSSSTFPCEATFEEIMCKHY